MTMIIVNVLLLQRDKKVEMQRFEGKKLIQVPVRDGISKAEELVEKASKRRS